jgi:hypothetical protein
VLRRRMTTAWGHNLGPLVLSYGAIAGVISSAVRVLIAKLRGGCKVCSPASTVLLSLAAVSACCEEITTRKEAHQLENPRGDPSS